MKILDLFFDRFLSPYNAWVGINWIKPRKDSYLCPPAKAEMTLRCGIKVWIIYANHGTAHRLTSF